MSKHNIYTQLLIFEFRNQIIHVFRLSCLALLIIKWIESRRQLALPPATGQHMWSQRIHHSLMEAKLRIHQY